MCCAQSISRRKQFEKVQPAQVALQTPQQLVDVLRTLDLTQQKQFEKVQPALVALQTPQQLVDVLHTIDLTQ